MSPVVEVCGACKRRAGRVVLDAVDLNLAAAEILVLLGPNGAGKTTLLRTVCGRLRLDEGTVRVFDADPRTDASTRARIGLVPQHLAFYPFLSVRENLAVFGRLMGIEPRVLRTAVMKALVWCGLEGRAHDRAETLSGGMQRRLNVAAGLIHRPAILLLDEPTVGLDVTSRERIQDLLLRLRERDLAVLITTHDMKQAEELADRVAFMVDGRIRRQGRPADLVREVFDDGQQLQVRLSQEPREAAREMLAAQGLRSTHGALTWVGPVREGFEQVSLIARQFRDAGLAPTEVRVRKPGLEDVFVHVTGRELGP